MASAILSSQNDPRSSHFMPKFTNNHLNFTKFQKPPNRNPNPNPNFTNFVTSNTNRDIVRCSRQHLPSSTPSESINSGYRYITFRIDSYTKTELKRLKERLISDLERVRILRQFVCSTPIPKPPKTPKMTPSAVVSLTGQKRMKPIQPVREAKRPCGRVSSVQKKKKLMMRECSQILGKLMKHKHGWVFNTPVDAAAMKLYDYHNVVTKPMDLGTIRSKLVKNQYGSPIEFASDVRLTFENAMLYNGKGSDVYVMAERLLLMFEDLFCKFRSVHPKSDTNRSKKNNVVVSNELVVVETPVVSRKLDVDMGKPMMSSVDRREMTENEKAELAASLLNLQLGPEGMNQIMGIVKKGAGLEREGDEIELDLAVLDNETLWELHSFIGRALNKEAAATCNMNSTVQIDNCRERDTGEEDVDIGEEMQLTNFPPVEIERDVVNVSGSSSDSSSDSDTSSSDSGSGTSENEHEVNSTSKVMVS